MSRLRILIVILAVLTLSVFPIATAIWLVTEVKVAQQETQQQRLMADAAAAQYAAVARNQAHLADPSLPESLSVAPQTGSVTMGPGMGAMPGMGGAPAPTGGGSPALGMMPGRSGGPPVAGMMPGGGGDAGATQGGPNAMPAVATMATGGMGSGSTGSGYMPPGSMSGGPKWSVPNFWSNQMRITAQFRSSPPEVAYGMLLATGADSSVSMLLLPASGFAPVTAKVNGRVVQRRPESFSMESHREMTQLELNLPRSAAPAPARYELHVWQLLNAQPLSGTGLVALELPRSNPDSMSSPFVNYLRPQDFVGDLPEVKVGDELIEFRSPEQARTRQVTAIDQEWTPKSSATSSNSETIKGLIQVEGERLVPGTILFTSQNEPAGIVLGGVSAPSSADATGLPRAPNNPDVSFVIPIQRVFDEAHKLTQRDEKTTATPIPEGEREFHASLLAEVTKYKELPPDRRVAQKEIIANKLVSQFDVQMAQRSQEIAELAQRLDQLREATQKRRDSKEEIVNKQLNELLQP